MASPKTPAERARTWYVMKQALGLGRAHTDDMRQMLDDFERNGIEFEQRRYLEPLIPLHSPYLI